MNRPGNDNINIMPTMRCIRLLDRAYGWYKFRHIDAYAKKSILWTQSGVRVETFWLKLKTTLILQNICGETLRLER